MTSLIKRNLKVDLLNVWFALKPSTSVTNSDLFFWVYVSRSKYAQKNLFVIRDKTRIWSITVIVNTSPSKRYGDAKAIPDQ